MKKFFGKFFVSTMALTIILGSTAPLTFAADVTDEELTVNLNIDGGFIILEEDSALSDGLIIMGGPLLSEGTILTGESDNKVAAFKVTDNRGVTDTYEVTHTLANFESPSVLTSSSTDIQTIGQFSGNLDTIGAPVNLGTVDPTVNNAYDWSTTFETITLDDSPVQAGAYTSTYTVELVIVPTP